MYMAGLSVDSIALQRLQSDTEANLKNSFATASVNPGGIPGPLPLKTEAKPEPSPAPSSSILTEIPRIEVQKPISEWTVSDVSDFLTQKGFTDAANKLCQRNIDGKELLNSLDPAAMRKLEIPVGHSLKIVKLISEIRMPGPL
jgi:SAM domain (Sterile alpha motif)